MQDNDQPIKFATPQGGFIVKEVIKDEDAGQGLPAAFVAQLQQADAVLLIGSSETKGLSMQPVIAGGMYEPEQIASHALVAAMYDNFDQLLRQVNGKPTDAQRYRAFREFATMEKAKDARFEVINTMLMQFEETSLHSADKDTPAYMDAVSDFLIHALAETEPTLQAPTTAPLAS